MYIKFKINYEILENLVGKLKKKMRGSTLHSCFYSFFMQNCLGLGGIYTTISAPFAGLFQYCISRLYYL